MTPELLERRSYNARITRGEPRFKDEQSKRSRAQWMDPEYREKTALAISKSHRTDSYLEKMSGENNPNWRGGISNDPYPIEFNERLKRSIQERDGNMCTSCGSKGLLHVHHKNQDKMDSRPENLITLCPPCHGKAHLPDGH